jgi:hypothetical protein
VISRVVSALLGSALFACVSVSSTTNPLPPAKDWSVYSSLATGIAVALPPWWRAFDLSTEREAVRDRLAQEGVDRQQAEAATAELTRLAGRFVAIGPLPSGGAAFAYAVNSARPAEGRDAYVAKQTQVAGRIVVPPEHLPGHIGDVLHRRIELPSVGQNTPTLQDQFFVERFERLYVLFIQYQSRAGPEFSALMTMMGKTFTPIR